MPTLSERIQDTVNGPTGVRDRSLYDSIQKAIDETRKADLEEYNKLPLHERMQLQLDQKAREENTENWGWASRAGIRGVLQTGSMLGGLTGMAASAAEGLGVPEEYTNPVEEWGYGTYQSLERKASLYPGTEFSSDLLTSPTQAGKWVVEKLIENAPYLAMSWGTGAVGRAIGSRIAEGALGGWLERQTGKKLIEGQLERLGSNTGIIASTAGLEGGGMWGETLQKTGVDNPLSAMALGTVNGFVELAGGSTRVFNRIFGDQTNLYTKAVARMKEALWKGKPISVNDAKIVKRFATGLIQTGREEALEEGIQELNNLANIAINDPTFEKFTWENGLRIAESMVAGGATGGLMGATAAPFNRYGIIQEKIENLSPKELVPTIQQQAQLLAEEPDNKDQQEIVNRLLQRQLGETNPGYQDLLRMYRKEKDPEKKKLLGLQIEVSLQAELDRIKNLGQEKPEEKPPQETPPQTQPEETAAEPEKKYTILKEKPQADQGTPIDQAFVDEFLRDQGTPPEVMRGATPEEWEAQRSQREFDWRKEERAARSGRMRSAIGRVEDAQTQPYREEVQAAIEASQSQSPEVMDAARQRAEYRRQRIAELRENRKKARLLPLEEARRQRELAELEEEDRAAAEQNIRDVENMFPPKRVVPQKAIPSPGLHAQAEELKTSRQELVNAYLESARTGKPPQGNQALRRALTEMDADETRGLQIEALHELERRSGLIPAKKEVRQLFGVDLQEAAGMLEEAFGPDWAREQALRQTQAQGGKRRETLPSIYLTSGGKPFLTEKATTARARELAARGIRTRPVPVEGGFGLQRIEPEVTPSDREDQAGVGGEVGRGQEPGRTVSQPGGGGQTVAAGGVVQAQEGEEVKPETPAAAGTGTTPPAPAGETPPSESTTPSVDTPTASLESRIFEAYMAETGGKDRQQVRLADFRKRFPDTPREELDAELARLKREGKILLIPQDDPLQIKDADREAAINIAGRDNHLIIIEGEKMGKPAPVTAKEERPAQPEPTNWQEEHNARLAAPVPKGVMPEGDPNHFLLGQMGSMAKELRGVWETSNDESFHDPKKYPQELTFKTADADTVLYKKNIQYHLNVLSDVHGYTAVDERNENGIHIIEFSWNTKSAKADQGIKAAPIKEGVKRDPSAWGKPKFEIPKVKSKAEKKATPEAEEKPLTKNDLKAMGREAAEARLQAMPAFQVLGYAKDWKIPLGANKKKEQVIKEILQHVFDALSDLERIRSYIEGEKGTEPDLSKIAPEKRQRLVEEVKRHHAEGLSPRKIAIQTKWFFPDEMTFPERLEIVNSILGKNKSEEKPKNDATIKPEGPDHEGENESDSGEDQAETGGQGTPPRKGPPPSGTSQGGGTVPPHGPGESGVSGSDQGADEDIQRPEPPAGNNLPGTGLPTESSGMEGRPPVGRDEMGVGGNRPDELVPVATGPDVEPTEPSVGQHNYDLRDKDGISLSRSRRIDVNEQVKEILARRANAPETLTDEERDILRQYTGAGGLASGTVEALNQHYTDYETIRAIYHALDAAGFKYRKALEPAVGSGNFVGNQPRLDWTTVDIDETNHQIVKLLYPDAKHYNISFEDLKEGGFDLVISNVPFLENRGVRRNKPLPHIKTLHDFYFVHALDKVKDNGLVVFITSTGTMDKLDDSVRQEIVAKADIIGAFRLPGGHFAANAHTDVTTDIIFMQKRPAGAVPSEQQAVDNQAFVESKKDEKDLQINSYYKVHPEHILGELVEGKNKLYGGRPAYEVRGEADLSKINIQYHPYGKGTKPSQGKTLNKADEAPTDSAALQEWAAQNGFMVRQYTGNAEPNWFKENILIQDGKVFTAERTIDYSNINGKAKLFQELTGDNAAKILQLNEIKKLAERFQEQEETYFADQGAAAIERYQETFKKAPDKDSALKGLFKRLEETTLFSELTSYFDENFEPADIFKVKTRYTGSGKGEVTPQSPLVERAFYHEDNQGIIRLPGAQFLSLSEVPQLLHNGYSLVEYSSNHAVLQNDILYYSGNVYRKGEAAQKIHDTLSKRNAQEQQPILDALKRQIEQLNDLRPTPKSIDEIHFRGNEGWIFPLIGDWVGIWQETDKKSGQNVFHYADNAFEKYLNNHVLIKRDEDESIGLYMRRMHEAEERVADVKERIRNKIKENPELLRKVEYAYNSQFRGHVKPDYSKARYLIQDVLNEIEQSTPIRLRQNQIEWIIQAVYEGKGINAHDVGGGKTFAAIALARVLKKRGVAHKPLFIVPAKTIKKWERDIKTLFPNAKIINLGKLAKEERESQLMKLANTNADYVLISHEGFQQIKLDPETEVRYIDDVLHEHLDNPDLAGREKAKLLQKIADYKEAIRNDGRNTRLTFDKLGIDMIVADEAHAYKNIGIRGELVKFGLGTSFSISENGKISSARAYDFRFKANHIIEKNNDKNVFMLTATPTPNKPMELYTMLRHLSMNILKEYGIRNDQDFSNTFFLLGTERKPGRDETKNILTHIINVPELRGIIERFIDKRSIEDMPWITIPEEAEHRYFLERSTGYALIAEDLEERQKRLPKPAGKGDDTLVAIYTGGRAASTDPRLYGGAHARIAVDSRTFNVDDDKVEFTIQSVTKVWKNNPKAGQLVFLDNAGHEQAERGVLAENLHREIKNELVKNGLKATEVVIINGKEITNPKTGNETSGGDVDQKKQDIADLYNQGKIKVLIGTTQSMGEGMDLQVKTTDIYHLDIPWTPGAYRQRNGRGIRFGNENKKVNVHYIFMKGTYDLISFEVVAHKKGWNEAIWDKEVAQTISTKEEMMEGVIPARERILIEMESDPLRRRMLELEFEQNARYQEIDVNRENLRVVTGRIRLKQTTLELLNHELQVREQSLKDASPNLEIKDADKRAVAFEKSKEHSRKLIESTKKKIADENQSLIRLENEQQRIREEIKQLENRIERFQSTYVNQEGNIELPQNEVNEILAKNPTVQKTTPRGSVTLKPHTKGSQTPEAKRAQELKPLSKLSELGDIPDDVWAGSVMLPGVTYLTDTRTIFDTTKIIPGNGETAEQRVKKLRKPHPHEDFPMDDKVLRSRIQGHKKGKIAQFLGWRITYKEPWVYLDDGSNVVYTMPAYTAAFIKELTDYDEMRTDEDGYFIYFYKKGEFVASSRILEVDDKDLDSIDLSVARDQVKKQESEKAERARELQPLTPSKKKVKYPWANVVQSGTTLVSNYSIVLDTRQIVAGKKETVEQRQEKMRKPAHRQSISVDQVERIWNIPAGEELVTLRSLGWRTINGEKERYLYLDDGENYIILDGDAAAFIQEQTEFDEIRKVNNPEKNTIRFFKNGVQVAIVLPINLNLIEENEALKIDLDVARQRIGVSESGTSGVRFSTKPGSPTARAMPFSKARNLRGVQFFSEEEGLAEGPAQEIDTSNFFDPTNLEHVLRIWDDLQETIGFGDIAESPEAFTEHMQRLSQDPRGDTWEHVDGEVIFEAAREAGFSGVMGDRRGKAFYAVFNESALLSRKPGHGLGSKVETVRNYVKSLARLFNVPIDVVQSVSDLPAHLQRQFRRQSKRGDILRGVYDPESGGVYLVADGIDDRREALTVVLHEVVGHAGLRKVLGEDYDKFLRRMAEGKYGDEIKALMRERGYKDITQAADEWFAEQVEAGTIQPTLWNRFVHFIKQALRKLGFNIEFGKAELVELVRRSREAVTWRNPAGETKAAEPTFDFPAIRTSIRGQHASASLFDKFMSEKVGTGEGHQTFGWGIYVTDLEEVADYYLQTIPRMKNEEEFGFDLWLDNGKITEEDYSILEEPDLNNALYDYYYGKIDINELRNQVEIFTEKKISKYDELTWQREELGIRKRDPHYEALKEYADMARSLLNAIDKNSLTINPKPDFKRVLYDVTMFKGKQPGDYDLLRWDQPVPEGQREKIAQLMDRYDEYGYLAEVLRDTNLSGEEIYREIEAREGSQGASLALDEVEINGIQYPTGTFSHEKGGGWNYVIFNPLNITIENRAMYSTKPQPGEAKAEHERSWSESIREGMDTLRDWIKEMRGRKDWKTMRPETTWLERIFATPAYYFGKVPALQRVMKAALEMFDNVEIFKNTLFNADGGKGESYIARISQFRKAFKKEYQRWAGYIVDRDRNAVGYTVRRDGDRFQVHNPAGEAVKSYAKWEDAWAFAFQQEAADMAKLDKPFSEAAQQALLAYRTIAFNEYMMLSEPLRRIVEKAQAEGRPVPTVAYPVYGTDKDGKTRKRMMEVDLRVALDMMGERIGYYMPRLRRQGRYQLIAEKDGIRELQYFKTRAGLEREAAKLRKEGYKIQKGRARQLPGEVYGELGPTMAMENVINQALRDMRRGGDKTRLEDFGLKGEWRKTTDGKDEFVVTGQFDSRYVEAFKTLKGHGFYEGAWHFVEPGENFEGTIVKRLGEFTTTFNLELAFAQELVQQVADVLRSHGSLAHRIKRSSATGEEVWRGYSEEPFEAIVTAGRNIAAGHAKGIMARKMHDAIMGRDISWQQFVEQAGPDSTYEDYLEMVNERRIDPATQPNAYKDGVDYMKDMLRPSESLDRTIGMIKGAAMFKYIAGRVSAPVINLTALPTVVVASLRGHAHIPFARAVRLLTKAIRDYTTYSFHPEKLDAETRELFQEIRDRGWDMAQYNEEALEALRGKTAQRYDKFIDTLMLGFSVSERLNRAATIAAAYRGIKDQHEGEWTPEAREAALEQAKFASDRAHSIYGKANYPMLMRGGGAFGETAKSFYMFKNFAHNFLQNFIELGFKKREAAAAAWLIMSPIAVGGATAALPVSLLLAALRQVMDDDPEEALMEFLQENVGDSAEMAARFGVFGLAGVNLKGSLQVGITDIPTKVTDLLGAPYEVWVDLTGGIGDMIRGDITKGAEKVSPLFLGNMLKALREYNEGLTTKSNAPIFFGNEQARADTTDAVLRFLSFNPSRLARIHEKQFNERLTEAEFTESRQDIYAKFKKYFLMPEEKRTKAAYIDLLSEVSEYNNRVQGVGRADIPRITGESIRNALRQAVRAPRKERIRAGGTLYGATAVGRPSFAPQATKAPRAPQAPARPLAAAMPQRRLRDFMETA